MINHGLFVRVVVHQIVPSPQNNIEHLLYQSTWLRKKNVAPWVGKCNF